MQNTRRFFVGRILTDEYEINRSTENGIRCCRSINGRDRFQRTVWEDAYLTYFHHCKPCMVVAIPSSLPQLLLLLSLSLLLDVMENTSCYVVEVPRASKTVCLSTERVPVPDPLLQDSEYRTFTK
jgi:hypothetical protein